MFEAITVKGLTKRERKTLTCKRKKTIRLLIEYLIEAAFLINSKLIRFEVQQFCQQFNFLVFSFVFQEYLNKVFGEGAS